MDQKRRDSSAGGQASIDRAKVIIEKGLEYKLKIEQKRESMKDKELAGCTFVP